MLGATQTIRVMRPAEGSRDVEGRKIATYVQTAQVRGNVHERTSRELTDGQWVVVGNWTALLPGSTVVTSRDVLVTQNGMTFRVETAVERRDQRGRVRHVACQLVKVDP